MEIRRLLGGDGARLCDVRLRALADAPYAFSSSLDRESVLGPEFWDDWVAQSELGERGVVFVAEADGSCVAMAGGFFVDDERDVAMLGGMWVAPSARRGGLAQRLLEAVAGWAQACGAQRLRLAVTDCEASAPAAALYRTRGFVETGEHEALDWNPSLTARIMSRSL